MVGESPFYKRAGTKPKSLQKASNAENMLRKSAKQDLRWFANQVERLAGVLMMDPLDYLGPR